MTPRARTRGSIHRRLVAVGVGASELLLRPERFFRALLRFRSDSLPAGLVWIVGIAAAFDRLEMQLTLGQVAGRPTFARQYEWLVAWPTALILGTVMGLLAWLFWGWWYRMRLRLCGAPSVPARSARLVWLYARSVSAVPIVCLVALATPVFEDFRAFSDTSPLALTVIALLVWSIWVGYQGAVSCFPVKRVAALWWFLILPLVLYGLVFLVAISAALIPVLRDF